MAPEHPQLDALITQIPKTDLHLHLDGSVRPGTIADIGRQEGIELPSYSAEGLQELVFKDHYESLEEYLTTFGCSCAVMQKPEHLERIAYEVALDNLAEGVRYIEVRFAPQQHINQFMDMRRVLESVDAGLRRAQQEFNQRPEIIDGSEPAFYYGIIVCAMRSFNEYFSSYYKDFISMHSYSDLKNIRKMASDELVHGAVKIRDDTGLPIVGFDLAGAEKGYPPRDHWRAYQYAHENFMSKTVHAGEAYGAQSIFQAITELHADRIGHGYYLFDTEKIHDASIVDKKRYVDELSEYIARHRITIEVCLTSNMQTNPSIKRLEDHAFRYMLERELSTTFCTDNRTVSNTSVTQEILLALRHFPITPNRLKSSIVCGFKRSFFPDTYSSKRRYVRSCINYYEKLLQDVPLAALLEEQRAG
ncbi:adenosine deaminase [candidate division KSB3 bacterium]|uniref:adenosine deaminase n=1 Tax=candidate division KSB3 bacterium TaxID=2044937 RepID=A0A2G6E1S1_9BACT|nr:MAG: adenosine deaminase [candidate division KSB3 bacterium]PIE28618.1 MAG: adenosine deaminase [candidate division KSB3 bacterium]